MQIGAKATKVDSEDEALRLAKEPGDSRGATNQDLEDGAIQSVQGGGADYTTNMKYFLNNYGVQIAVPGFYI